VVATLTDEEKQVLRTGAFGAVALVSNATPGAFGVLRESFAASGPLAGAGGLVREALLGRPLPILPAQPAELEATVLAALRRAVVILTERAPAELTTYQRLVEQAIDEVANADRVVSVAESEASSRVRAALGIGSAD
jgi:hypothetical protein